MVQMKTALGGIPVSKAMLTDFQVLSPRDTIGRAAELILSGSQTDFPVLDGNAVMGVLTRSDILAAISGEGKDVRVAGIMRRDILTVDANEMLEPAFARLQACNCHTMPVISRGQLIGLLTSDNIGEFLMIQAAITQARSQNSSLPRGV
jgi:predicted transcriptional regulator